jgi:hypothetical protein
MKHSLLYLTASAEISSMTAFATTLMTPEEYFGLQTSDMEIELKSLDEIAQNSGETEEEEKVSEVLWKKETQAISEAIQAEYDAELGESQSGNEESRSPEARPVHPLLVCDSTPLSTLRAQKTSRMERLETLLEGSVETSGMKASETNDNGRTDMTSLMYIQAMQPLSNTDESTCWIMSATPTMAMSLCHQANLDDESVQLQVQPILPMMKMRKGNLDAAKQAVNSVISDNDATSKISITASFSPGLGPDAVSYDDFTMGGNTQDFESTLQDVKAAFPYTSLEYTLINMDEPHPMKKVLEHTELHSIGGMGIYLEVHVEAMRVQGPDLEVQRQRLSFGILSLLSALASKDEIYSLEVMPQISVFHGGDRHLRQLRG